MLYKGKFASTVCRVVARSNTENELLRWNECLELNFPGCVWGIHCQPCFPTKIRLVWGLWALTVKPHWKQLGQRRQGYVSNATDTVRMPTMPGTCNEGVHFPPFQYLLSLRQWSRKMGRGDGGHLAKLDVCGINQLLNGEWYYQFSLTRPFLPKAPWNAGVWGVCSLFSLTLSLQEAHGFNHRDILLISTSTFAIQTYLWASDLSIQRPTWFLSIYVPSYR